MSVLQTVSIAHVTPFQKLKKAETNDLDWPIPETLTNKDIEILFYRERATREGSKLPDFEYVHMGLAKSGTLSLLWAEYYTNCELENTIPYQPSQFN